MLIIRKLPEFKKGEERGEKKGEKGEKGERKEIERRGRKRMGEIT
jgi:hypothetical protein